MPDTLKSLILSCIARDFSIARADWRADAPYIGYSEIIACMTQELLGGTIVVYEITLNDGYAGPHYAVKVNGIVIDLLKDVMPIASISPVSHPNTHGYENVREYLLSFPWTSIQFEKFAKTVVSKMSSS